MKDKKAEKKFRKAHRDRGFSEEQIDALLNGTGTPNGSHPSNQPASRRQLDAQVQHKLKPLKNVTISDFLPEMIAYVTKKRTAAFHAYQNEGEETVIFLGQSVPPGFWMILTRTYHRFVLSGSGLFWLTNHLNARPTYTE